MKKILLLSILFTAGFAQNQANAQCTAPLSITPGTNPGEVELEYDLLGVTNPSAFYGEVSFYNTTTSTSYPNAYINQGNNPYQYTFVENGTYDIWSLTMDSITSCIDTIQYTYVVTGLTGTNCEADFSIVNDSISTTSYYGYNYSTGTNLTYSWDFGDGGTSSDQYPSHNFNSAGTFDVCLTIDDGNGCTDIMCQSITVWTKASETTLNIYDPSMASLTEKEIKEISVFPNPSNGEFSITFNSTTSNNAKINILDIQGKVIATKQIENSNGQNNVNFDLQGTAPGVYFYQIDGEYTGKLIVR